MFTFVNEILTVSTGGQPPQHFKIMKTNISYNEIENLGYKVKNVELRAKAGKHGIVSAVRDLRMTLLTGTKDTIVKWRNILTASEDGEIVMTVWFWLFGCYPTIVTECDKRGFIIDAWVNEI